MVCMKKTSLFALVLLASFSFVSAAQKTAETKKPSTSKTVESLDPQTELVMKSISERYEKLQNWKAEFANTSSSATLGTTKFSNGNFVFSYPNRFRFSLNGPSEVSDFISNGKTAWYARYPKGRKEAALVQRFPDVKNIDLDKYLVLLKGFSVLNEKAKEDLLKTFKFTSSVNDKHLELILEPKSSDDLVRIKLVFDQSKEFPEAAQIETALSGETLIKITKAEKLKSVKADEFEPKFPKGSKIEDL